jgi:hypothetical protein
VRQVSIASSRFSGVDDAVPPQQHDAADDQSRPGDMVGADALLQKHRRGNGAEDGHCRRMNNRAMRQRGIPVRRELQPGEYQPPDQQQGQPAGPADPGKRKQAPPDQQRKEEHARDQEPQQHEFVRRNAGFCQRSRRQLKAGPVLRTTRYAAVRILITVRERERICRRWWLAGTCWLRFERRRRKFLSSSKLRQKLEADELSWNPRIG